MRTPMDKTVKRFVKWALWYGRQRYRVAPMWQDTKKPVFPNPDLFATVDPDIIKALWGYGSPEHREAINLAACVGFSETIDSWESTPRFQRPKWADRVIYENERKLSFYGSLESSHAWNVGIFCGPTEHDDGEPCGPTMIDIDGQSHGTTNGMSGFDSWKALTGVDIREWSGPKHETPSRGFHVFVDYCPALPHCANALGDKYPHIDIVQRNLTPAPPSIYGMESYQLHNWCKRADLPPVPSVIIEAAEEKAKEDSRPRLKRVKKVELNLKDFPKLPKHVMRNYANTFQGVESGKRAVTAYHNAKRLVARFPHLEFDDYIDAMIAWNDHNVPPLEFNEIQNVVVSVLHQLARGEIALVLPPWMDKSKRPSKTDAYREPDATFEDAYEYVTEGWFEYNRSNLQLVADIVVRKFTGLTDEERIELLDTFADYVLDEEGSKISKAAYTKALDKAKDKPPYPTKKRFVRDILKSHGGKVTPNNLLEIRESIKTLMPSVSASERIRILKGMQQNG